MRNDPHTGCHGPDHGRRSFLARSLAALVGAALPLGAAEPIRPRRAAKACILLWMNGGPSHIDTFDPKPGTKAGGAFRTVKTKIRGVEFCEHLPHVAEQAEKLAVIRSMTSKEGNHDRGQYLLHTGYSPSGTLQHPAFGSWVSRELGDARAELPNFVTIKGPSVGAGFLGVEHNPFAVQNPAEGVRNLPLAAGVDGKRFDRRMDAFDLLQKDFAKATRNPAVGAHGTVYQKAVRLMRSPLTKAFDIKDEPEAVRRVYGDSDFGRGCLMARRLVEAGVKFVEVTLDGWDTHVDNFTAVRNLLADVDPAMASLLRELAERDRLRDTLVIWMGEFGRTPTITAADGRDHHPAAWSAVLAGGGVRAGQVYGATDSDGAKVVKDAVTVPDFFATLAVLLGMDPDRSEMSPVGRPIAISDAGTPVRGLLDS
jgi:uncharacterized protein (DUF1501 family)